MRGASAERRRRRRRRGGREGKRGVGGDRQPVGVHAQLAYMVERALVAEQHQPGAVEDPAERPPVARLRERPERLGEEHERAAGEQRQLVVRDPRFERVVLDQVSAARADDEIRVGVAGELGALPVAQPQSRDAPEPAPVAPGTGVQPPLPRPPGKSPPAALGRPPATPRGAAKPELRVVAAGDLRAPVVDGYARVPTESLANDLDRPLEDRRVAHVQRHGVRDQDPRGSWLGVGDRHQRHRRWRQRPVSTRWRRRPRSEHPRLRHAADAASSTCRPRRSRARLDTTRGEGRRRTGGRPRSGTDGDACRANLNIWRAHLAVLKRGA